MQTALERYRGAKVKCLAESTREARKRLDEARAMMENAGSLSRGRSTNDCPKQNAARFVRVWQREAARAERAELLAARRPTVELRQVCVPKKLSWLLFHFVGVRGVGVGAQSSAIIWLQVGCGSTSSTIYHMVASCCEAFMALSLGIMSGRTHYNRTLWNRMET